MGNMLCCCPGCFRDLSRIFREAFKISENLDNFDANCFDVLNTAYLMISNCKTISFQSKSELMLQLADLGTTLKYALLFIIVSHPASPMLCQIVKTAKQ